MNTKAYEYVLKQSPHPYVLIQELKENLTNLQSFIIIQTNNSFENIINLSEDKLINRNICDIFNIDSYYIEDLFKCSKLNKIYTIKEYIKELNGWFKVDINYIENDKYIAWFTPIYKLDEYNKVILNNNESLVWIKDIKGRYIDINKALLEGFKLNYEDVIGKTDFDILDYEIANKFYLEDRKVLHSGNKYKVNETKIGNKIYEYYKHVVVDNEGNIIGLVGYANDKTNELSLKNKLEQQQHTMEILIDAIPDYIFYKDLDSTLIYCNKSYAEKLVQLPKKDIIGRKDSELAVVNEDAKAYRERDLEVIQSNSMKIYYEDVTLKDGSIEHLETIKVPYYNYDNEVVGIIGIARDITDRVRYQEELENIKMNFFTNLSHELRTPLNLIFSTVQMMRFKLDKLAPENSDYYNRYIDITNQNALRLLKLVNNLIDSNKISSGYMNLETQNYDIVAFVENICMSVSEFINQKNMMIIFDTDIESKIICFDLDKLERIILNLLSNAIKFNKENENIEVNITDNNDYVYISIKDNGIGIPEEKLPYIFDRYKQVENNHIKLSEGSGIGLCLVKLLVEMHGGEIVVNSEVDRGTEFIVKIPNKLDESISYNYEEKLYDVRVETIQVEFSDIYK